ncbi:hypothetical protein ANCCAN_01380 [Ancylostoma caninum]|uniref:Uncharacterized protein n=1 Tax=Ancylostoma caninum TaxID=29170 RepID=A0A368H9E2_ANCCA|nr:hypothetical protein ANCCAN_01380 [Ancylostoma caninum]
MTMLRTVVVLVLCLAAGYAEENVKNATAEGRYSAPVQNDFHGHHENHHGHHGHHGYHQMPFYGGFNFGIYGYGRHHDTLINTHVCSIDASYAVYSHSHKRHNRRPHILDCSDAFFGAYYPPAPNYGYTQKSCDKCCKNAARLDGMKESEILGMMLVQGNKAKCACCAPYRPYMDLVGVPVQYYQPRYEPQPSYGQPSYPSNDQPTSY